MYFCYLDDSGSAMGRTLTGLLVPAQSWSHLLEVWLEGRAELTEVYGVRKHAELKGVDLGKVRGGALCETEQQDAKFRSKPARADAFQRLMAALARCPDLRVLTVVCRTNQVPHVYQCFLDAVDQWAADQDEHVLLLFDGIQMPLSTDEGQDHARAVVENSVRNAAPFRDTHRSLYLRKRRVLEDPIMQDSRYNQLIQAADLAAYAAFQHLRRAQLHPLDMAWPGGISAWAADAYMQLSPCWLGLEAGTDGVHWRDVPEDPDKA